MSARRKRKRKWPWLLAVVVLAVAFFDVLGNVTAKIVHVDYVDAFIYNLSPALEGTTVLFASDFKLNTNEDADNAVELLKKLNDAAPDVILLGGDYTAMSHSEMTSNLLSDERREQLSAVRQRFFRGLNALNTPGGIYAVAGDMDFDTPSLYYDCLEGGVMFLEDKGMTISINGASLLLYGCSEKGIYRNGQRVSNPMNASAVIGFAHHPDTGRSFIACTDSTGSTIADLILCGHTLGGQINVGGWSVMRLAGVKPCELKAGYYDKATTLADMLVSTGVGTDFVPLRLGSRAQVYMITLHRKNHI